MSINTFGRLLRFTTWGEKAMGRLLGAVVDGCPPGLEISEAAIQPFLDARPGQSKFTTQRQEPDAVAILSGVFEGRTIGTDFADDREMDQRSKDYSEVARVMGVVRFASLLTCSRMYVTETKCLRF